MVVGLLAQANTSGFDVFLTKLIDGAALGAVYTLMALGFVIIFKSTQVLSFAHGAVSAAGAYLVAYFITIINWPGRYLEALPATLSFIISAMVICSGGIPALPWAEDTFPGTPAR